MTTDFTPDRLTFARKKAGLTRVKLAGVVGVSPRTLANYESGDTLPTTETVKKLAMALFVPESFFAEQPLPELESDGVHFRAYTKMTKLERTAAMSSGVLAIELERWLSERLHMPVSDVPRYERGSSDPFTTADRLRVEWEMGYARIRNALHLLESHGVRVFSLPERLSDVDAFSFWWEDTPFVVLNTRKSAERGRFDAVHELGHLVMHGPFDVPRGREREFEANRFAAAFLMPEHDVLASGLRNAGVEQVLAAKSRWGVSAMALTYRLHELGMISDWVYTNNCRRLTQLGYRGGEPDRDPAPRESSAVLDKAFRLLRERGISLNDVAREVPITPTALREMVFGLVMTPVDGGAEGSGGAARGDLRLVER